MDKEKSDTDTKKTASKDTRIALPVEQFEAGLANALDQETYKAMFRPKGMRNVQHLSDDQREVYNNARDLVSNVGTIKGADGVRYTMGIYIKKS